MKAEFEHEKGIPRNHQKIDSDGKVIIELVLQDRQSSLQRLTLFELFFRISMFLLSIFQLSIVQPPTTPLNFYGRALFLMPLVISLMIYTTYASYTQFFRRRIMQIDDEIFKLLEKGSNIEDVFIRSQIPWRKTDRYINTNIAVLLPSESLAWLLIISLITLIRMLQY